MSNEGKEEKYKTPKAGKGDAAHALVRAGLGAIPVAGAAATELLNAIVAPPLEKRRNKWMEQVGEGLRRLEEDKGINLEELRENDIFIDIALQATQSALRTNQKEKLEALRNTILNSASPDPPEESLQQMFINFVDTFTVWHLVLLDFLHNPEEWAKRNGQKLPDLTVGGVSTLIESAFSELKGRRDFYDQLGKDLYNRGLIHTTNFHATTSRVGLLQKKTTDMGDQFLEFIRNPLE